MGKLPVRRPQIVALTISCGCCLTRDRLTDSNMIEREKHKLVVSLIALSN